MRIVLDTNVIVSAIIGNGKPRKLFRMGIENKYKILVSRELLEEISDVLQRPKFRITKGRLRRIISALAASAEIVTITSNFKVVKSDPADDVIINTAFDGKSDYIVSGDENVYTLKHFKGIKILSVVEMLKILENS